MSKAKKAVEQFLHDLNTGRTPVWARKTGFITLCNGSVRHRISRNNGTVEKSEIIPAGQWQITAARAGTGLSQAEFAKLIGVSGARFRNGSRAANSLPAQPGYYSKSRPVIQNFCEKC